MSTSYWVATASSEAKKLCSQSPTWRGLAGTGDDSGTPLDRKLRKGRLTKKRLFADEQAGLSESDEDEESSDDDDGDEEEEDHSLRFDCEFD